MAVPGSRVGRSAIAVDATIVCCRLVPAVLELMGKSAWWLRWLDRALPHISVERHGYFDQRQPASPVKRIKTAPGSR